MREMLQLKMDITSQHIVHGVFEIHRKVIVDEELRERREKFESVRRVSARPRKCWLVLLI